jgi:hypothetical protein
MKFLSIIVFLWYVLISYSEKSLNLRLRNTLLRVYIANDKKKIINEYSNKIAIKTKSKVNIFYNKILSKYYDVTLFYNTLTDEEKEIIDAIISLYY